MLFGLSLKEFLPIAIVSFIIFYLFSHSKKAICEKCYYGFSRWNALSGKVKLVDNKFYCIGCVPGNKISTRKTDDIDLKKVEDSIQQQNFEVKSKIYIIDPKCPYCKQEFNPIPKRKKKCPNCENFVYVKYSPSNSQERLVTELEKQAIEQEWQLHYQQIDKKSRKDADLKWGELNKQVVEAMKIGDWATMKQCYNEMVYILGREGRSAQRTIEERNRCELMNLKESSIEKVEILTARNETVCKYCASLEGKISTIDEALKTMPIPGNCSGDVFGTGHSFCRCEYLPVIE